MHFNNDWDLLLKSEFTKDYFINLLEFLKSEESKYTILPPKDQRFNALKLTSYQNTKAVIIGQDPYHGINQSHGLAFSVLDGIKIPPSLNNIYKELSNDLNITRPKSGNLTPWANEGVLLLNTIFTVRENAANSHRKKGWEIFTDKIINLLNQKETPIVFILWGNEAISKEKLITNSIHYIIKSPHPSPLSAHRGFFGSKPFSKTNNFLINTNQSPIKWEKLE